ncbi:MAG: hypothetical protein LBL52_02140 [Rickettsiales bacterium]|jgi:hypothetical protein|nr:hypothetical protein [Rickettsiales bacterium]
MRKILALTVLVQAISPVLAQEAQDISSARASQVSRAGKKKGNGGNSKVKLQKKSAGRVAKGKRAESAALAVDEASLGTHTDAALSAIGADGTPVAAQTAETALIAAPGSVADSPDWEGFTMCMRGSCGGGNSQPANVRCYEDLTAEDVFNQECKIMVATDPSRAKEFYDYFHDTVLPTEQKEACNRRGGLWDTAGRRCLITITYRRKGSGASNAKGVKLEDNIGCDDNVPKQVELGGTQKSLLCKAEIFGKGPCFNADNKAIDEVKTQQALGVGLMVTGVVGGTIGGILAGKPKDGAGDWNVGTTVLTGVSGAVAGVGSGLPTLLTANSRAVGQGTEAKGNCSLPDGSDVSESQEISLEW